MYLRDAFPDRVDVMEQVIADGDRVGLLFRVTGTHTGAFFGIAPTGKRIDVYEIAWLVIKNGQMVEGWFMMDEIALLKQLGVKLPARADGMPMVLRTHTSPVQARALIERGVPLYIACPGTVYRTDELDATHTPVFTQVEGLAIDRGLTLADLKGTLLHVMRALYGPERRIRFRTHYFPFTEPSIEPDVSCGICAGRGCRTCKHSGWIEMGGAGMVDPQVLLNVGLDPEEWGGFAFGCGLERTAQLRHDIPDIRALWEGDLRVLRQF